MFDGGKAEFTWKKKRYAILIEGDFSVTFYPNRAEIVRNDYIHDCHPHNFVDAIDAKNLSAVQKLLSNGLTPTLDAIEYAEKSDQTEIYNCLLEAYTTKEYVFD